jgi:acyl carrier protein
VETATKIRQYLEQRYSLHAKGIHLDENMLLLESRIIDSIGMLELMLFLEETFGITIPEEEISPDHFGTIRKIEVYLDQKCRQGFVVMNEQPDIT